MKEMHVKDTKLLERAFVKSDSVVRWVRQKDRDWTKKRNEHLLCAHMILSALCMFFNEANVRAKNGFIQEFKVGKVEI